MDRLSRFLGLASIRSSWRMSVAGQSCRPPATADVGSCKLLSPAAFRALEECQGFLLSSAPIVIAEDLSGQTTNFGEVCCRHDTAKVITPTRLSQYWLLLL